MAKSKKKDPELRLREVALLCGGRRNEVTIRAAGDRGEIKCRRDHANNRLFRFSSVMRWLKDLDHPSKYTSRNTNANANTRANAKRHAKLIQQEARTQEVIRRQLEAEQSQRWTEQHELKALEKQLRRKERPILRVHPTLAQIRRRTAKVIARCEALDLLAVKEAELQRNLDATRLRSVEETRKLRQAKHEAMERANAMRKEEPSDGNAKPH